MTVGHDPSIAGVAVIVPAHNEEDLLGACLDSVHRALDHRWVEHMTSLVVVVLDQCSDRSRSTAERHTRPGDVLLDISSRNVGIARAAGSTFALEHLRRQGARAEACWLGHTDADSVVPPWWITRQLRYASTTDAIAGVVRVEDWSDREPGTQEAFSRSYQRDGHGEEIPDGSHLHVHGANLGMRGDAYLAAGGFPDLACSEDHALWNAIRDGGRATLSTRRLWVTTSARRSARAAGGFADALSSLEVARAERRTPGRLGAVDAG